MYTDGIKNRNVPIMSVFLKSTALPRPLKIPSKVKAIEFRGWAIITIQKKLSKLSITSLLELKNSPVDLPQKIQYTGLVFSQPYGEIRIIQRYGFLRQVALVAFAFPFLEVRNLQIKNDHRANHFEPRQEQMQ